MWINFCLVHWSQHSIYPLSIRIQSHVLYSHKHTHIFFDFERFRFNWHRSGSDGCFYTMRLTVPYIFLYYIFLGKSCLQKKKQQLSLIVFLYTTNICSHNKHTKLVITLLYKIVWFISSSIALIGGARWFSFTTITFVLVKSFLEWKLPSIFNSFGNVVKWFSKWYNEFEEKKNSVLWLKTIN